MKRGWGVFILLALLSLPVDALSFPTEQQIRSLAVRNAEFDQAFENMDPEIIWSYLAQQELDKTEYVEFMKRFLREITCFKQVSVSVVRLSLKDSRYGPIAVATRTFEIHVTHKDIEPFQVESTVFWLWQEKEWPETGEEKLPNWYAAPVGSKPVRTDKPITCSSEK